jgi:hypothetical protein
MNVCSTGLYDVLFCWGFFYVPFAGEFRLIIGTETYALLLWKLCVDMSSTKVRCNVYNILITTLAFTYHQQLGDRTGDKSIR